MQITIDIDHLISNLHFLTENDTYVFQYLSLYKTSKISLFGYFVCRTIVIRETKIEILYIETRMRKGLAKRIHPLGLILSFAGKQMVVWYTGGRGGGGGRRKFWVWGWRKFFFPQF